jgi:hypothetical protein
MYFHITTHDLTRNDTNFAFRGASEFWPVCGIAYIYFFFFWFFLVFFSSLESLLDDFLCHIPSLLVYFCFNYIHVCVLYELVIYLK